MTTWDKQETKGDDRLGLLLRMDGEQPGQFLETPMRWDDTRSASDSGTGEASCGQQVTSASKLRSGGTKPVQLCPHGIGKGHTVLPGHLHTDLVPPGKPFRLQNTRIENPTGREQRCPVRQHTQGQGARTATDT